MVSSHSNENNKGQKALPRLSFGHKTFSVWLVVCPLVVCMSPPNQLRLNIHFKNTGAKVHYLRLLVFPLKEYCNGFEPQLLFHLTDGDVALRPPLATAGHQEVRNIYEGSSCWFLQFFSISADRRLVRL